MKATDTMKQRLTILFLALSLLPVLSTGARAQAFLSGDENLTYAIRHSMFPGSIGTMTFQGRNGGETYHVDASLTASIAGIYSLNATYGATFRKDDALTPVSASRTQTEKKYQARGFYNWSAPGTVHLDVTKSTRPPRNETLSWNGTVRDLLDMIWWLRTLDYSKGLDAGNNALLLDHDPLPVNIVSCTKGTLKYKGVQMPVLEVLVSHGGNEALRLTLSDDDNRQLMKFSIALSFGTIKGTLK